MDHWRGKWALITGASAGIGWALAEQLAAGGTHLVLTARRKARLDELAAKLSSKHGVQVETFAADLGQPGALDAIFAYTQGKGIAVELLVNNAGFGAHGEFQQIGLARQLEMVQVNVSAVLHLTHLFLPSMIERRSGDILIVASTAGFQGVPYISAYAATKAFDLLFAEGLAEEVRKYGVRVCALCPGSTATEFHEVAKQSVSGSRIKESAEKVARVGLEALARGKSYVISGVHNYISAHSQRLVPRRTVNRMAGKIFAPKQN
ncbi:MAG: SDR family oxidoreductase [Acidobacteria bacterium]|nr:SDR family oxidoreductase [Acidobacteriota bacterium]